jgi:hypothetical protein
MFLFELCVRVEREERRKMFDNSKIKLECRCGHTGTDFVEINLILNDSIATIKVAESGSIGTEKTVQMFVCPQCSTVQIHGLKHP